jgi:phenylacetate-coenzyme A ligase PaaK-like adenylate-forming protein
MSSWPVGILDVQLNERPDPDEFVQAAMQWHFGPETGSRFWLERARSLAFDPRIDVKSLADLSLFPNVTDELRDVPVRDLVPRGYGPSPQIVGIYESGGTTGAPKRVVLMRDWLEKLLPGTSASLDRFGIESGVDWLFVAPSGPHGVGEVMGRVVASRGGIKFTVDMDPRWVKKLTAAGRAEENIAYVDHLIEQAAFTLRTQNVSVLMSTPPILAQLTRNDEVAALIRQKVGTILWGGTGMDPENHDVIQNAFPRSTLVGFFGNTMFLASLLQRSAGDDGRCIFDSLTPWITFCVIDPQTGAPVPYENRGQVVTYHVTRSFLLPNNLERDMAARLPSPQGAAGDSIADVGPMNTFDGVAVVEGLY